MPVNRLIVNGIKGFRILLWLDRSTARD